MTNSHDTSLERAAPDLLTIDEAAAVMRIGRTKAYELARRYVDSGGADCLPGSSHRQPAANSAVVVGGLAGRAGGVVGKGGFEPPTPCSQSRCATRLRHTPNSFESYHLRDTACLFQFRC